MSLYNSSLGRVCCSAASHDPSHNKFNATFWILCSYMKMYVSFRSSVLASLISLPSLPPSLNRSPSVSSVLLSILWLSSGHFFVRLPRHPPSTFHTLLSPLALPLSGWPSTSFISARSSVCLPSFFFGGGGELISFPISPSYMLGEAPCMGVNEGAAWVNPQGDG